MQPVLPAYLIARGLLLLVLLAGAYFLSGFLVPALALIIGLASWPVYQRLVTRCGGRTALAATLALLVVIVVLVVPLSLALSYAIKEASSFFAWAIAANRHGVDVPAWITSMPVLGERLAEYWLAYIGQPTRWARWSRPSAANTWATSIAWCWPPPAMCSSCC